MLHHTVDAVRVMISKQESLYLSFPPATSLASLGDSRVCLSGVAGSSGRGMQCPSIIIGRPQSCRRMICHISNNVCGKVLALVHDEVKYRCLEKIVVNSIR